MNLAASKTTALPGLLLKTGITSLFAGFALSLAVSAAPRLLFSGPELKVDFTRWSWMKGVELDVAPARPVVIAALPEARIEDPVIKKVRVVAPKVKVARAKSKSLAIDHLAVAAAAPVLEVAASPEERARLQGAYGFLRNRFHAALEVNLDIQLAQLDKQPELPMNTQVKAQVAPKIKPKLKVVKAPAKAKKIQKIEPALPAGPVLAQANAVLLYEIKPTVMKATPSPAMSAQSPQPQNPKMVRNIRDAAPDRAVSSQNSETRVQAEALPTPSLEDERSTDIERSNPNVRPHQVPSTIDSALPMDQMKDEQWVTTQVPLTTQVKKSAARPILVAPKQELARNGYPLITRRPVVEDTPPKKVRQFVQVPPEKQEKPESPEDNGLKNVLDGDSVTMKMSAAVPQFKIAADKMSAGRTFVEAYEWVDPIRGVRTDWVSRDSQFNRGWATHTAEGYIPTLAWHAETNETTPLLSNNSALLLSKVADVKLHPALGMVFGRIPEGWTVELSGRAERPVFVQGTFAFLNAEPEAKILYVRQAAGSEAAVGIPVLAGTATYVDIQELSRRTVSGIVVSADAMNAKGVSGIQVSVAGQSQIAVTDRKGRFSIQNVQTIGTYPLFIETNSASSYTHRYTALPAELDSLTLFQISEQQRNDWLSQLEGGISPQSGLVVAALPKVAARYALSRVELMPGVLPLTDAGSLEPESYVLSSDGEMQAGKPISSSHSRFVSIEVPEGPAVAFVGDASGKRWSELFVAQRGVINVIGPR